MIEHLRDDEQVTLPIATFNTPISDNLDTLQINIEPKQNFNGYDHPWVGGAGKNLWDVEARILNQTTASGDASSSYSLSEGIVSISATYGGSGRRMFSAQVLPTGTYTFSAKIVSCASNNYVTYSVRDMTNLTDVKEGTRITVTAGQVSSFSFTLSAETNVAISFQTTTSGESPLTFTDIQLEFGSTATAWTPYENICPIYPNNGVNLLENTAESTTNNGITFTVNADGTVTANGTATAQAVFTYSSMTFANPVSGDYLLNGNPIGASSSTYRMRIRTYSGSWSSWGYANSTNAILVSLSSVTQVEVHLIVLSGQTVNIVWKPMLRPASISDSAYVPYKGIGITRTGKNIANLTYKNTVPSVNNGQMVSGNGWSSDFVPVDNTKDYYLSMSTTPNRYVLYYTADKSYINFKNEWDNTGYRLGSVSFWDNVGFVKLRLDGTAILEFELQLECGGLTEYEPYTAERYYPISDNPVYGGTLDVVSGVLTVTKELKTVTSFTGAWGATNNGYAVYNSADFTNRGNSRDSISNMFTVSAVDYTAMPLGTYQGNSGANTTWTFILPSSVTSLEEANAWLNGLSEPLVITETLVTPQTYQLTPQQIKTLIGTNNIWSDSGSILHAGYRAMTEPSDSDYGTEVLTPTENKPYLWNYERIAFTDGTHVDQEKHILAVYGSAGKGIQKVEKEYYLSTSDTSVTGGLWSITIPSIDVSKYLWTRDKITYTTGDPGYTTAECITKYTSDIVSPDISNAITTANDYSAGLVTTERNARLEAIETITTNYDNLASTVSSNSTSIATNAQNIELRATKTEVTQLSNALAEVQQFRTTTTNYLTFDATRGLVMSATINGVKSPVESVINNSAWQLVTSGKVVQQVDANEGAQFSAIVLKALSENDIPTLTLGHLVISVQTNGTVIGKKA